MPQRGELMQRGKIPGEYIILILVLIQFFLSFLVPATGSRLVFDIVPWYFLIVIGSVLFISNSVREWFFFGGLSIFGFVLAFSPVKISSFIVWYLALFFLFILVAYLVRPRVITGKVLLSDDKWAVVDVGENLLAGVPKGIYAAKSKKGIRKGDNVLLRVIKKWGKRELRVEKRLKG